MMASDDGENKKEYYKWSKEDLERALLAYEKKEIGINAIARQYQVPKATILRHAKLLNKFANNDVTHKGRPTVFSIEQEKELVDHLLLLENHMFGLTINHVRRLAYQIAEYNKIPHSFNREKEMASKRWFYAFKKRHPEISLRQPESTSLNRIRGFNRENVSSFYDLLEKIVDNNSIQASNIFNVDETGVSTVQKKAQKVVGLKGKRQIGSVTSGEHGINTTVVCCANAAGQFIPPMLIFKRKRNCPELADGAPADSVVTISDTGYINSALFVKWLKHFIAIVKPTQDKKVLLLLDGHTTHTRNLEALTLARDNGIIMVQLPGKGKKQDTTKTSKTIKTKVVMKTTTNKKKVVKKAMKRKRSSSPSDSDVIIELDDDDDVNDDDDNVCASCGKHYFDKSGPQVEWLQCVRCNRWLHETCTTNPDICDDCLN